MSYVRCASAMVNRVLIFCILLFRYINGNSGRRQFKRIMQEMVFEPFLLFVFIIMPMIYL
jgi:hypothetical protein